MASRSFAGSSTRVATRKHPGGQQGGESAGQRSSEKDGKPPAHPRPDLGAGDFYRRGLLDDAALPVTLNTPRYANGRHLARLSAGSK
jgi:hypothetical protein